jgi:hypothetical protein
MHIMVDWDLARGTMVMWLEAFNLLHWVRHSVGIDESLDTPRVKTRLGMIRVLKLRTVRGKYNQYGVRSKI